MFEKPWLPDSPDSWSETWNCCNLRFCDDLISIAEFVESSRLCAPTPASEILRRHRHCNHPPSDVRRSRRENGDHKDRQQVNLNLRDVLSPGCWDLPRSPLVTDQWPLMSGLSHDVTTLRYWWSVSVTHRVLANSTTSNWNRIINHQFNSSLQVATSTSESGSLTDRSMNAPTSMEPQNQCRAEITRTTCQVISFFSCSIEFSLNVSTKEPMRTLEAHITYTTVNNLPPNLLSVLFIDTKILLQIPTWRNPRKQVVYNQGCSWLWWSSIHSSLPTRNTQGADILPTEGGLTKQI